MANRAMWAFGLCGLALAVPAWCAPAAAASEPAGHITGVGGVFIKAQDRKALVAWYRDVLGLPIQPWGGAVLHTDAPLHPPVVAWTAMAASSSYFAPSASPYMIDYAVDDMDAFVARLTAKGVAIIKRTDDETGRFAWIMDPEGNKIELWEPKRAP